MENSLPKTQIKQGVQIKILGVMLLASLGTLLTGLYGLNKLSNVASVYEAVAKEQNAIVRGTEESLLSMSASQVALETAMDINDHSRNSEFIEEEKKYEESVKRFSMFLSALAWGSESEAFARSSGGENLILWQKEGLEGKLVIPAAREDQSVFAGQASVYNRGFINHSRKALSLAEDVLLADAIGNSALVEKKKNEAKKELVSARRFAELTIKNLIEIAYISNERTSAGAKILLDNQRESERNIILVAISGLIIVLIIGSFLVRKIILVPLQKLFVGATKISEGKWGYKVDIKTGDEFEYLSEAFNKMSEDVASHSDNLKKEVAKRTEDLQEEKNKLIKSNEELNKSTSLLIRRDLELSRVNEKLRELDNAKSEFISIVAHQLRTPLSGIKWTLNMLTSGSLGELNKEQQTFLLKTGESNERMISFVNNLLDVDRLESGRFRYTFAPLNLRDILDSVLLDINPEARKKKITINVPSHEDKLPQIYADAEKMRAVFQNTLENAVKYTGEGGRVDVTFKVEKEKVTISVSDNGIGVPKEMQHKLFSRFYRAPNAIKMQSDGSGLGLYIVKAIIEKHKGNVWFETEEGKGFTVSFSLPTSRPRDLVA